jgi:hypothetical protein
MKYYLPGRKTFEALEIAAAIWRQATAAIWAFARGMEDSITRGETNMTVPAHG